jgi:hypothetical protein
MTIITVFTNKITMSPPLSAAGQFIFFIADGKNIKS